MLICAEELNQLLDLQNLVIFDCRFQLGHPHSGREAYLESHIPGAFYLDLELDLSAPKGNGGGRHPLPDPTVLAGKLGAAGVADGVTVVLYDGGEGMVARAWWLLQWLGHADTLVLDGGWTQWCRTGNVVTAELPSPHFREFQPRVHSDWLISAEDVERWLAAPGNTRLLDARAAERFRGEIEPLDPKAGHIPGALNRPWTDNLTSDGRWKSPDELRLEFAALCGPAANASDATDVLACYCGSGVTACANVFALRLAGYQNIKLYAGSWSEWCANPRHPVATM